MTAFSRTLHHSFISALTLITIVSLTTPGQALDSVLDNITIDNGDKGILSLPKIEVAGTNLTQEELNKLFAGSTPEGERRALASRLQASKLAIPTATISNKNGKFVITGFSAAGIDAGKIAEASLVSVNGDGKADDGGPITFKTGAVSAKGLDLVSVLKGDMEGLTITSFTLADLALTAPDKDTPASAPGGNLINLSIASIIGNGTYEGPVPTKGAASIKGLTIVPPPASKGMQELKKAGMDKMEFGFDVAGTYDTASLAYSIDDLKLTTAGLGALNLRVKLAGIPKQAVAGKLEERLEALMQGKATSADIIFDDAGLVEKSLVYFAAQQGKTPAGLRLESAMMARQMLPVLLGGAANSNAIAEQVGRFIESPKQLTINLRPKNGSIGFLEMLMLSSPPAFLQAIDVNVTAVTGAAPARAATPAAPAATAPAAVASNQTPGPSARLTGLPAWNALIGKTIAGKNDDGQPFFEYYLADGTLKRLDDTDVSTGTWSFKKGQVCFEYSYADEEACYRIVVDGTIATFTDVDGNGKRYEILPGNPKKL